MTNLELLLEEAGHPRRRSNGEGCAARDLLDRLGDKWSLLILLGLRDKEMRFNALKRRMDGISQHILTRTLRSLERDGFISRTEMPGSVARVDYALTRFGRDLLELTHMLIGWADARDRQLYSHRAAFDAAHRQD